MRIQPHRSSFQLLFLLSLASACTSPLINDDNKDKGKNTDGRDDAFVDSVVVVHTGAEDDPYTVAEARWLGDAEYVWVEGYVVGTVKNSMRNGCDFEPPFEVTSNILLADTFPAKPSQCLPVELKGGTLYQYALNLVDNPDVYQTRRRILADLTDYFSVTGLRNLRIVAEPHPEDVDSGEGTETEGKEGESLKNPLTVAAAIENQGTSSVAQTMWVRGYIVGFCGGKDKVTFVDSASVRAVTTRTNVALADSIGEKDKGRVVIVKLPDGFIREDVNLPDHPENYGKRLTVSGILMPYNNLPGVVDVCGASSREDLRGFPLYVIE